MDFEFAHQFEKNRTALKALKEGENRIRIPTMCMGRVSEDTVAKEQGQKQDFDIYNGTYITSAGTFRVVEHIQENAQCREQPHRTFVLTYAKHAATMRGSRTVHGIGDIIADADELTNAHPIAAYRYDYQHDNMSFIEGQFAEAMETATSRALKASSKNFIVSASAFRGGAVEAFSNSGYSAYLLEKHYTGVNKVKFFTSIKRKEDTEFSHGGFLPLNFREGRFHTSFSKIAKPVISTTDYNQARTAMMVDMYKFLGMIWDEKNIFKDDSILQKSKKLPIDIANELPKLGRDLTVASILTGAFYGFYPEMTFKEALVYIFSHAAYHKGLDMTLEKSAERRKHMREAKRRSSIIDYSPYHDCSDVYKDKSYKENIFRRLPSFDLDHLKDGSLRFCTTTDMNLLPNHTEISNDLSIANVQALAVLGHQRGHSGVMEALSNETRLHVMQNGALNLHQRYDGKKMLTATMLRPEFALTPHVQMPDMYKKQYGEAGEIMTIYYDGCKPYSSAWSFERGVDPIDLSHEFKAHMFDGQQKASNKVKNMSFNVLDHVFSVAASGQKDMAPIPLPYWSAALTDFAVEAYREEMNARGESDTIMFG